jgi:hypothetical protein
MSLMTPQLVSQNEEDILLSNQDKYNKSGYFKQTKPVEYFSAEELGYFSNLLDRVFETAYQ